MHLRVQLKKTLQCLNKSVFDKFEKLFRNSHAIAKASRPQILHGLQDLMRKRALMLGRHTEM